MLAQTLAGQKVAERPSCCWSSCARTRTGREWPISLGRITQANLARMIGATRQSISLILNRLQGEGIILTGPTKMIVHDLAALRGQLDD